MNIYSSESFLRIAAEAFYPNQRHCIDLVCVKGLVYRVLTIDGKKTVGSVPFMDFLEATDSPPHAAVRKEPWLPRVCHRMVSVDDWQSLRLMPGFEASPTIVWQHWPDFASFCRTAQRNNSRAFSKRNQKKWRQMALDLSGTIRYKDEVDSASAPALLAQLMEWKSLQYQRSGYMDSFARPATRKFFQLLLQNGLLKISGVFSGERPLALHAGFMDDNRFYFVLPAYDFSLKQYAPGQLLLESMLESSFVRGHREFDFLLGDEPYKFYYANQVRIIGPLGFRWIQDKVWAPLRRVAIHAVRKQPIFYKGLQKFKRTLKMRGIL